MQRFHMIPDKMPVSDDEKRTINLYNQFFSAFGYLNNELKITDFPMVKKFFQGIANDPESYTFSRDGERFIPAFFLSECTCARTHAHDDLLIPSKIESYVKQCIFDMAITLTAQSWFWLIVSELVIIVGLVKNRFYKLDLVDPFTTTLLLKDDEYKFKP